MTSNPSLKLQLKRLSSLHPKLIDLSLGRVTKLLNKLENPQNFLPPIVHVAGTNGKGSTIAFMRSILEAAGYKVHVYSSPHLLIFNERICLAGKIISDESLLEILTSVEKANGQEPITFFEITTVAAFIAFATSPADILLLETGLGGRLDATNVVKNPLITVLTSISLDHQKFLGTSLAEIAREKAGIIKPGHPCVVGRQSSQSMQSIIARSQDVGSPLYMQDEDWSAYEKSDSLFYSSPTSSWKLPRPNLLGSHQINNCGLAIAALERCPKFQISGKHFEKGVSSAFWPGRLQHLKNSPLISRFSSCWELWLDGGHNPEAGRILSEYIYKNWTEKPLYVICGMIDSKDCKSYLSNFSNHVKVLYTVTIPNQTSSVKASKLALIGESLGLITEAASSPKIAIEKIYSSGPISGRILICGSLYLAGAILAEA